MSVDVVVVSFNTRELLRACLTSVQAESQSTPAISIFVVDNNSHDGSPQMVADEFPGVTLIALDRNIGFGPANNRGARAGHADYLLFLNSDAELTPGALHRLVQFVETNPDCIAVGPRLEYPDGRFQPSCRRFPTLFRSVWNTAGMHRRLPGWFPSLHSWLSESEHARARDVDMVSGACFLIRRTYFESIGGFDENLFMYEEEMDLMLPARRRGYRVCYVPDARVIHHHGASSGEHHASDTALFHLYRSKYYTFRKHYGGTVARLTYWSDYAVFALSGVMSRLRRRPSPALRNAVYVRRGFQASK